MERNRTEPLTDLIKKTKNETERNGTFNKYDQENKEWNGTQPLTNMIKKTRNGTEQNL